VLGDALAAMAESVDQRIVLEAALVRLASVEADTSPAALLERIERLERALASGGATPASPAPPAATPAPPAPTPPPRARPAGAALTRDDLTLAWGDVLLGKVPRAAKALYTAGRFVSVENDTAVFALPNAPHMARCEEHRPAIERVLSEHFGRPILLTLTVDNTAPPPPAKTPKATKATKAEPPKPIEPVEDPVAPDDDPTDDVIDVNELEDAPPDKRTHVDRLTEAFPGAELLPEESGG